MIYWLPPLALLLDILYPDPRAFPHPVQGIAFLANRVEVPARRLHRPVAAGGFALLLILMSVVLVAWLLTSLPSFWGTAAAIYLSWSGLALGGLVREGKDALNAIMEAENAVGQLHTQPDALKTARGKMQMLVSRDTSKMDTDELYRSLAETVSENFNDAFVAPYFWLCFAGPVGLWFYKAASTMDSMWGYKNERWLDFGKAAARLDDVLAYVPARLSSLLMILSVYMEAAWLKIIGKHNAAGKVCPSFLVTMKTIASQARLCDSPNAGWPMAAAACLFNGRCGGPTPYDGQIVAKPLLGHEKGKWEAANVAALIRHVRIAGILGGLFPVITLLALTL